MKLVNLIKDEQNYTFTENGALALESGKNDLIDLFAVSGSLRNRSKEEIELILAKALLEDKLLATKLVFYTRDVRGGLGERKTGRIMFNYLNKYNRDILNKNLELIPEYGRWDDLICLMDDNTKVVELISKQLNDDLNNMNNGLSISLLAKWLPSVNASNKKTINDGKMVAKKLAMSEKQYRQTLSKLRKYLNIVETNISNKQYDNIVYSEVPSKAMNVYRNVFSTNDNVGFKKYLDDVKLKKEKINSSTIYPYDIIKKYLYDCEEYDEVLEQQWKSLPNYVEGENNFLVMADVSGSMRGFPLATSIGLSLYFGERNTGAFSNTFMTFSNKPVLVSIKGDTLYEKIVSVKSAYWDCNTNLEAAFNLVLDTAVKNSVKKKDMPTCIVVISDMEIDMCEKSDWLFYDQMKDKFNKKGYEIPNVVFWNVYARNNCFHASFDKKGVIMASGQSPIVFRSIINNESFSPYGYMLEVLNDHRYDSVKI